MKRIAIASILAAATALTACTTSPETTATSATAASTAAINPTDRVASTGAVLTEFERDRQAILAMIGNHTVKFEFTETVAFADGYVPKEPYLSGANEVVVLVEDAGDFISLQHILVVGYKGEVFPIKHWRQDWRYEPKQVLTFIGGNAWEMRKVARSESRGKWSQTVYQTDDSPRYGAVGDWLHNAGLSQWVPPAEWRPLPRRDMTTRDDYHAVDAVNIHAITPDGWAHEQSNLKLALNRGETALVREVGVNTYNRDDNFETAVATEYWEATKTYWSAVREIWREFETPGEQFALTLKGEPAELYSPVMGYAEEMQNGDKTFDEAVQAARTTIAQYTTRALPPLEDRLRQPAEKKAALSE
ncbi:MAG: DUF6607 family protein [Pseudomonadota bacterium]